MDAADFISPTGELTADLFPGIDLSAAVTAWINDALTRTSNPNAQRSWVLYRAYAHVADRMHAGLASESKGPASASRSDAQFRYWRTRANAHLAAFRSVMAPDGVVEVRPVW